MRNLLKILLFCATVFGIILIIYYFTNTKDLTSRESLLLGVFLTFLSTLASWLITHYYASIQQKEMINKETENHRNNLRMFASKAAEKVNNISNELNKLALYLKEELDEPNGEDLRYEVLSLEDRIYSAIRIIESLKSFNDTALSDWKGIIDDVIEKHKEERQQNLKLMYDLAHQLSEVEDIIHSEHTKDKSNELLIEEIKIIRDELKVALDAMGIVNPMHAHQKIKSLKSEKVRCPKCEAVFVASIKSIKRNKIFTCKQCSTYFNVEYDNNGLAYAIIAEPTISNVRCPFCESTNEISIYNKVGITKNYDCEICGNAFTCHVKTDGVFPSINPKLIDVFEYKEEIIEKVNELLPEQPWPTGIHKAIAEKLSITPSRVSWAISELIKRGLRLPQQGGKIITTEEA